MMRAVLSWAGVAAVCLFAASDARAGDWQAGVATTKITPQRPMWMSGYASRTHPADGVTTELWAKALVLEDDEGLRAALITLDLVGIDRDFSQAVCAALKEKYKLERRQVALCTSHTHSGPVVGRVLLSMYSFDDEQRQLVADYTADLENKLVALVGEAIANLSPARIAWSNGHSTIAVNRRNNREPEVPQVREQGLLKGPVDHEVPVLSVRRLDGKLAAIVFGYACHATVVDFYQWSGDYPGFAQIELEKSHPGAVALFFAGCGGDQNPLPRRTVEYAQEYGRSLARSVDAVLAGVMKRVEGGLVTRYVEVPLALDTLPSRDAIAKQLESTNKYEVSRAKLLLKQIDGGRPLSPTYPYPLQAWFLGPELQWVTLGGEVTVDYSLRLKRELGTGRTWVAAYTNDVMAYIPSRRVLKEGGYEGGGAMLYYGLPTVWSDAVEETIVEGMRKLVGR
ncbi:MAG: neutral/alkaline non-lysosomal ceramidase N-terminal domain-containing protein [Planctomycetia bacterium]|nr:neutral/alkaline non-lysosomal ceramidase N-terminal domain-containing protein [Planctomycetia bacterium]